MAGTESEWLIQYTLKPTNFNRSQRMIVIAGDRDEAYRTWANALTRRGDAPGDYSPQIYKYDVGGTLGRVVEG